MRYVPAGMPLLVGPAMVKVPSAELTSAPAEIASQSGGGSFS
jgi:hypothetical protein